MNTPKTPEYRAWAGIIQRCLNPNDPNFPRYGGRGITVCEEWIGSSAAFLAHVGPRPSAKHTIDRIDNNGNYKPGNVRWATKAEQAHNTRRNRFIDFNGRRQILADWARETDISPEIIAQRLDHLHWTIEEALTTPANQGRKRNTRRIDFNGRRLTITDWARETGLSPETIRRRFNRGWTVEEALTKSWYSHKAKRIGANHA